MFLSPRLEWLQLKLAKFFRKCVKYPFYQAVLKITAWKDKKDNEAVLKSLLSEQDEKEFLKLAKGTTSLQMSYILESKKGDEIMAKFGKAKKNNTEYYTKLIKEII